MTNSAFYRAHSASRRVLVQPYRCGRCIVFVLPDWRPRFDFINDKARVIKSRVAMTRAYAHPNRKFRQMQCPYTVHAARAIDRKLMQGIAHDSVALGERQKRVR